MSLPDQAPQLNRAENHQNDPRPPQFDSYHDMAKLEDDLLYKLLIAGNATAEDQRYAAEWIARQHNALSEILRADGPVSPAAIAHVALHPAT